MRQSRDAKRKHRLVEQNGKQIGRVNHTRRLEIKKVRKQVRKISNWKSPGPDVVQG